MKALTALIVAAAGAALLSGCSITFETSSSVQSAEDRLMTICGMGVIQTPNGPRPAISATALPTEAYRTYTDCVLALSAHLDSAENPAKSSTQSVGASSNRDTNTGSSAATAK